MTAITEQPMPEYTPLFLWVINATGDTHAAGVHGVIYRRAQPTDGECEITAEDIAKKTHLPLEQVEWHIDTLIDRGIVRCSMEPTGARRFTLVSEEEWTAEFGGRVLPPVWDTDLEANVDLEADTDL